MCCTGAQSCGGMQKKYIIFRESHAENHLERGRLGCDAV
jgi:hypothetical protein